MVSVSASVNLPLHHKVQKFSSGTSLPRWSRKKGRKTVVVWWWWCSIVTWRGGPGGIEAWSLGLLLPSVPWHCWLTCKNPSPIWPIMCLVGCYVLLSDSVECCFCCWTSSVKALSGTDERCQSWSGDLWGHRLDVVYVGPPPWVLSHCLVTKLYAVSECRRHREWDWHSIGRNDHLPVLWDLRQRAGGRRWCRHSSLLDIIPFTGQFHFYVYNCTCCMHLADGNPHTAPCCGHRQHIYEDAL